MEKKAPENEFAVYTCGIELRVCRNIYINLAIDRCF